MLQISGHVTGIISDVALSFIVHEPSEIIEWLSERSLLSSSCGGGGGADGGWWGRRRRCEWWVGAWQHGWVGRGGAVRCETRTTVRGARECFRFCHLARPKHRDRPSDEASRTSPAALLGDGRSSSPSSRRSASSSKSIVEDQTEDQSDRTKRSNHRSIEGPIASPTESP